MLKQLSVPQKIFGAMIFLFAWSLFTKQASSNERTGTIAFLSDRNRDPLFRIDIMVYLIDADGSNEMPWMGSDGPIAWSPDGKSIAYHLHDSQDPFISVIYLHTPVILLEFSGPRPGPRPIIQIKEVTRTVWWSNVPIAKMVSRWEAISSYQH